MAGFPGDIADTPALLAEARRLLLEELLPMLPAERRVDGLMIASAIAMGERELAAGDMPLREAVTRMAGLFGENTPRAEGIADLVRELGQLERRLAADIRAGRFDDDPLRTRLVTHLQAMTRARLSVTNPKVLSGK